MNKIEKALLKELQKWDLSCSEEPTLKIDLAKALARTIDRYTQGVIIEPKFELWLSKNTPELYENILGCYGDFLKRKK